MEHKIINCPHCGKIIPEYVFKGNSVRKIVSCPECGSQRNCKNGKRTTHKGMIQVHLCRYCGHRFLEGFDPSGEFTRIFLFLF